MKNKSFLRWILAAICLTPLLSLRASLWRMPGPPYDFDTYWAAGRLFLARLPPYSPTRMLHLEQSVGWKSNAIQLMLCPPWTLPIFAPDGALSFHVAHLLWLGISIGFNFLSAAALWIYFGGSRTKLWIALLMAATYLPMARAEYLGQITPFILLCLTGFLLLTRKQRYFLAGLCLFALGIKPHLTYLVFLAVLIWIIRERRWTALAGALTVSAASMLGAAIYNPHSLDYFHNGYHVAIGNLCAVGGLLRGIFGIQHRWLQFLPSVFGIAWFIWYSRRRRSHWHWQHDLPLLILVSVSTAAYGWYHDFILVFPALIAIAARGAYRSGIAIVCYAAIQIVGLFAGGISAAWMFTTGLLWIPLYLYLNRSLPESCEAPHNVDQIAVS